MKFSCDNCGAQYMIADEKIGTKGVKVRCKKCAFVIVLRPEPKAEESAPDQTRIEAVPRTHSTVSSQGDPMVVPSTTPPGSIDQFAFEEEDRTVAMDVSASNVPIAPSVAAERMSGGLSGGSDISADFATDGFDEPLSDLAMAAQPGLEVGLDVGGLETDKPDEFSPFGAGVEGGGSLEQVAESFGKHDDFAFGSSGGGMISEEFTEQQDQTRVEQQWSDSFEEESDQTVEQVELATRVGQSPFMSEDNEDWSAEDDAFASSEDEELVSGQLESQAESSGTDNLNSMQDAFGEDEPLDGFAERSQTEDFGDEEEPSYDSQSQSGEDLEQESLRAEDDFGEGKESFAITAEAEVDQQEEESEAEEPATPLPPDALISDDSEDSFSSEIGAAFDAALKDEFEDEDPFGAVASRADAEGEDEESELGLATRIYDNQAEQKVEEEWARAKASESSDIVPEREPEPEPETSEWFLAIDDEQVGPLTLSQVQQKLSDGAISNETLCWKQGMADWLALRFVKELTPVIEPAPMAETGSEDIEVFGKPADEARSFLASENDPFGADQSFGPSESSDFAPDADEDDDISWQPKGADLLASLVAAEDKEEEMPAALDQPSDISFLGTDSGRSARERNASALFGANDVSAVNINRPLSRASQVSGTLGLRDAAPARGNSSNLIVPAVLVSLAIVAAMVIFVMFGRRAPEPAAAPSPAVAVAKAPEQEKPAKVAAVVPAPVTETPKPASGSESATPSEKAAVIEKPVDEKPAAAAPAKTNPAPKKKAPAVAKAKKKVPPKKKSTSSKRPSTSGSGLPAMPVPGAGATSAKAPERRIPPPPKRRAANPSRFSKDDLLGGAGRSEAPSLPKTLDEAQLLKVILRHKKVIRDCKKKQKAENPSLGGVMQVNLVIKKNGRTSKVKVAPPKFSGSVVGNCVSRSVKGWVFPKFTGPSIPLDFPVKVKGSR